MKKAQKEFKHQGNLIRDYRTRRAIPQAELARDLKIHPQFLSNIERGVSGLPPVYMKKICELLDLSDKRLWASMLVDYSDFLKQFQD